jgi:hypothetical protein
MPRDASRRPAEGPSPKAAPPEAAGSADTAAAEGSGPKAEKVAIIDGSNVAYSVEGQQASLRNIQLVRDKMIKKGFKAVVVVDAALRHHVDDVRGYQQMVDTGIIRQAPAGTDADYFILAFARELGASIVSNDRFRDREHAFPEALERIIRYMIVDGEVVLEHRVKRRD